MSSSCTLFIILPTALSPYMQSPCSYISPGLLGVNSVTLLGRVGVEPQMRGSDAHPVVTFSLATNVR